MEVVDWVLNLLNTILPVIWTAALGFISFELGPANVAIVVIVFLMGYVAGLKNLHKGK